MRYLLASATDNRYAPNLINSLDGILIGGVDEAGRGSIIGPLIVAGVSIHESKISKLRDMGVRDSKQLTAKVRARLYDEIISVVDHYHIHSIDSCEVDDSVFQKGLNRLEARTMASVIDRIHAHEVYVDCCDVNPDRYREHIAAHLDRRPVIHSMHHADRINVAVSAASILAKVTRDGSIQKIRRRYRSVGSGYPSDEKTMSFLRQWVAKKKCAPEFARRSWKPMRTMLEEFEQRRLF
jgi:ribonuclease HII